MFKNFTIYFMLLFSVCSFTVLSYLIFNSQKLSEETHHLDHTFQKEKKLAQNLDVVGINKRIKEKFIFYDNEIIRSHLLDGMLVNLDLDGSILNKCDSLLFSAIRYVSLKKMGFEKRAKNSWEAIMKSRQSGKWFRHPSCFHRTSRDMILGLLLALSQEPEGGLQIIESFFEYVDQNDGFFGDGPLSVSYLTPGMAEIFRNLSSAYGFDRQKPWVVEYGFSTLEFNSLVIQKGYRAHLIALQVWLESETQNLRSDLNNKRAVRSVLKKIDHVINPFISNSVYNQRLLWISKQLVEADKKNLFFRYLYLSELGELNSKMRAFFLNELLHMKEFPNSHLPQDCQRKADYLWQRDSVEYIGESKCSKQFNGVDFLWMAALLYKE